MSCAKFKHLVTVTQNWFKPQSWLMHNYSSQVSLKSHHWSIDQYRSAGISDPHTCLANSNSDGHGFVYHTFEYAHKCGRSDRFAKWTSTNLNRGRSAIFKAPPPPLGRSTVIERKINILRGYYLWVHLMTRSPTPHTPKWLPFSKSVSCYCTRGWFEIWTSRYQLGLLPTLLEFRKKCGLCEQEC